ncbi:MAG: glycosyltransferase [Paracoccaceae bacterium]
MTIPVATASGLRLAYLVDPRFRGGTSSSLLAELSVTSRIARLSFHSFSEGFLRGQSVTPAVASALENLGCDIGWDSPVIAGDIVVIHNPIFLSTYPEIPSRIVARKLVVVTHENFLRPGGHEGFDVARVLNVLSGAAVAVERWLAPVSAHNRECLEAWLSRRPGIAGWRVLPEDWTNVIVAPPRPPVAAPRDRRGRLSREGLEKYPPIAVMDLTFPPHAEANVLMGTELLTEGERARPHWTLLPFGAITTEAFFGRIDFMIYFTAPTWSESFGRVIAEAIMAGKPVIAGPEAGRVFGKGVIVAQPGEVDGIVARLIADPAAYAGQVRRAQDALAVYRPDAFLARLAPLFAQPVAA